MESLKKNWWRVVISLFAGVILHEIIFISSGDPNRPRSPGENSLLFVYALVIYIVLTAVVNKRQQNL